jgi:hypothetical protein
MHSAEDEQEYHFTCVPDTNYQRMEILERIRKIRLRYMATGVITQNEISDSQKLLSLLNEIEGF